MDIFRRCAAVGLLTLPSVLLAVEPLDINTASASDLAAAIDGVGESRAEAIVSFREAHGPFRSVDDLTLVQGVGQSTVDNNRDRLTVSP